MRRREEPDGEEQSGQPEDTVLPAQGDIDGQGRRTGPARWHGGGGEEGAAALWLARLSEAATRTRFVIYTMR